MVGFGVQLLLYPPPHGFRYQPRLTAANYRYFIRGQNSHAAVSDFRVRAKRQVHLKAYDKLLRKFRCEFTGDRAMREGAERMKTVVHEPVSLYLR